MHVNVLAVWLSIALSALIAPAAHAADLPSVVFEGLKGEAVIIERTDGSEIAGRLLSFDDEFVVVAKSSGRVVSVERAMIEAISMPDAPSAPDEVRSESRHDDGPTLDDQVTLLQRKSRDARKSGVINLAVWTPVSIGSAAAGYYLINEGIRTQQAGVLLPGVACLAFGATGVIMFPIRGATSFHRAGKYRRQAEDLEVSASVTPVWQPGGGGVVLVGTF